MSFVCFNKTYLLLKISDMLGSSDEILVFCGECIGFYKYDKPVI